MVGARRFTRAALAEAAKRKATQDGAGKEEAGEASKSKTGNKRVKMELPYLPEANEAGKYPNYDILLVSVPPEIFDKFLVFLDPDAQTCLSLTCKVVLKIVGREVWAECHSKRQRYKNGAWTDNFRHTLIPLLARDAPPHLVQCVQCMTLHPPLKPPREHRFTTLTKCCFGPCSSIDYLPKAENGGYSLMWEHIFEARKSLIAGFLDGVGPRIKLLTGKFTVRRDKFYFTLKSSAHQVKKNLILKHEHIFRGLDDTFYPLKLANIIKPTIRICPHQTTTSGMSGIQANETFRTQSRLPSGLLTHSIKTVAPGANGLRDLESYLFDNLSSTEEKQVESATPGVKTLWTCRACPTKWHVRYDGEGAGELKITVWHNLGDTQYRARENWKLLVRREGFSLGNLKRNSEFFVTSKSMVDFEINDEEV